jgi:hypothetical protein
MGYQGSDIPNQDTAGAAERLLGYSNGIEGIPLEGDLPLDPKSSATPNREDADFNAKGDLESDYAEDYFDAEEERLGDPLADQRVVATNDPEKWSEGVEDEANLELADLDKDFPDDQALPEMGRIELIEKPTAEQLDPSSSDRYITEE